MQIKACGSMEYEQTMDMLNGIYGKAFGLPPRLSERHPLLLGRSNMENMRIAVVDGAPVSAFNFYETTILIEGVPLKAASVGCVGTDERFRGRNCASELMDDAESKMRKDGVRLEIISGGRSLYTRKGASRAGRYFRFDLPAGGALPDGYAVVPYRPEMLASLAGIYGGESVGFYRSLDELQALIDSNLMPWGGAESALMCVMRGGEMEAWMLLRIEKGSSAAAVREYAGSREAITASLRHICSVCGVSMLSVICPWNDLLIRALKASGWPCKPVEWMGTVKIVDFEGLMADLLPYFRRHTPETMLQDLSFGESAGAYSFHLGREEVTISSISELNGLVLGTAQEYSAPAGMNTAIGDFFRRVFPLPFPWGDNMNVQ